MRRLIVIGLLAALTVSATAAASPSSGAKSPSFAAQLALARVATAKYVTDLDRAKAASGNSAAEYSAAVTHICAGALLFDHAHQMGTRDDALAIADDIRASTARRLAGVTALSISPEVNRISSRWISSQRRLASLYARTWVRIFDTIDAARTPAQQATLGERLEELVHVPDSLKLAAARLELELHVPDCTGGG